VTDLLGDGSPIPVYRTGDLGIQRADGVIEFRGRRDLQVKVRGVRVELEEVEAALCAAPGVEAAAAALRDGPDGEPLLAAWVLGAAEAAALHRRLSEVLPAAAVPSRIIVTDALPRLINGKIDRAALRLPELGSSAHVAPAGPVEARISAALAEVMGCDIGATDDVFALGASSLQALQLVWRLNEAFHVELPIDLLYHARTVQALAQRVSAAMAANPLAAQIFEVVELAAGDGPPVIWLPPAYGLTLAYRAIAQRLPGRAAIALEMTQPSLASIEELAAAAILQLRAAQPHGPYWLVGWSFGGVLAFEIARQLGATQVARLVLLDSAAPGSAFDFAAGDPETAAMAARRVGHMFGLPLQLDADALRGQSPQAMCMALLDVAQAHGVPISDQLRARALTVVEVREASMAAWRRYTPAAWPGDAWIMRASGAEADWTAGWDALLGGAITRRVVPGTHVGMLDEPHVSSLIAALHDALS
jgi:thioesterase domain-containing protein/acyl carrier protein